MNTKTSISCAVNRDLMPLVQDDVASPEAAALVKTHIENCPDCRALWQQNGGGAPAEPDGGRIISKIQDQISLRWMAVILAGAVPGFFFTSYSTRSAALTLVIMPVLGALALLFGGKRWYWLPVMVGGLGLAWRLKFYNRGSGPFTIAANQWGIQAVLYAVLFSVLYAALCLLGAGTAFLFRHTLRKGGRFRALTGCGGALLAAAMVVGTAAYTGDPFTQSIARDTAITFADETWPGHHFYVEKETSGRLFEYNFTLQAYDSVDSTVVISARLDCITGFPENGLGPVTQDNARKRLWWQLIEESKMAFNALEERYRTELGARMQCEVEMVGTADVVGDMPYAQALREIPLRMRITVNVDDEATAKRVQETILQDCKAAADKAGLPFATCDLKIAAGELFCERTGITPNEML